MPTNTDAERAAFWAALKAELPAFVAYLNQLEIPEALRCPRFGIKHYHHPDLLAAIDVMAPETELLALIDAVFFPDPDPTEVQARIKVQSKSPSELVLSAAEVQSRLLASDLYGYEAKRLLSWNNAIGTYLGRLAANSFILSSTAARRSNLTKRIVSSS
jgi:hypothetical protein